MLCRTLCLLLRPGCLLKKVSEKISNDLRDNAANLVERGDKQLCIAFQSFHTHFSSAVVTSTLRLLF